MHGELCMVPKWKTVTFQEAKASGRILRFVAPPNFSHAAQEGHRWCSPRGDELQCFECNFLFKIRLPHQLLCVVARTETELMQDAEAVLNYLGLKIDKEDNYAQRRNAKAD